MQTPKPTTQHIIDDAGVLNRTTKKAVNDELTRFEVGPSDVYICALTYS